MFRHVIKRGTIRTGYLKHFGRILWNFSLSQEADEKTTISLASWLTTPHSGINILDGGGGITTQLEKSVYLGCDNAKRTYKLSQECSRFFFCNFFFPFRKHTTGESKHYTRIKGWFGYRVAYVVHIILSAPRYFYSKKLGHRRRSGMAPFQDFTAHGRRCSMVLFLKYLFAATDTETNNLYIYKKKKI